MREHRSPAVPETAQHGSRLAHVDQCAVEAALVADLDEVIRERQDPVHGASLVYAERKIQPARPVGRLTEHK
jgi:hypothetical protein